MLLVYFLGPHRQRAYLRISVGDLLQNSCVASDGHSDCGSHYFFISFDRLHYTVDIVLGLIITFNIILVYHLVAHIDDLQKLFEYQTVDFVETSPKEFKGAIQATSATDSIAKFIRIIPATFVALLVRVMRWVDAKHLESNNEERQNLL